jgi:hypothetical protein
VPVVSDLVVPVDHVALVLSELKAHDRLTAELGDGGPEHVSGLNEPPYTHLQIVDSAGGEDGRLLWSTTGEVNVLCWGAPGGGAGKAELRRLLYIAVAWLARLPDLPHIAGMPVVVDVRLVGSARWQPHPATGQPCYAHTVLVEASPDNSPGT